GVLPRAIGDGVRGEPASGEQLTQDSLAGALGTAGAAPNETVIHLALLRISLRMCGQDVLDSREAAPISRSGPAQTRRRGMSVVWLWGPGSVLPALGDSIPMRHPHVVVPGLPHSR